MIQKLLPINIMISVTKKERISITGEACMNCYLMEIGEVDPQDGRCEKCGKRAANPLLSIS